MRKFGKWNPRGLQTLRRQACGGSVMEFAAESRRLIKRVQITCCLLLAVTVAAPLRAQVSTFTYQGRLNLYGAPANGHYDFMFRLLNDATNGVAAPVIPIVLDVPVSNGLFTTGLDFGAANFDGANCWLEINVRTNGGGAFTTLSPRQLLTSTPYAIASRTANVLVGALPAGQISGTIPNALLPANPVFSGTVTANNFSGNAANLTNGNAGTFFGIGTLPDARLSANVVTENGQNVFSGSNFFGTNLTVAGPLEWDDKPDISWNWRRFFTKAYNGIYLGKNGVFANVMFTGDSMANLKAWALMFQLTNVMPISAIGLDSVSMDGSGGQGELGGNGLSYGSGGNRGGAFTTLTNYDIVINGTLTWLPPGTTTRFYPGPVFMLGTPWWNGQVLSVCTLTEPGGGTADVYAQQYGNHSPYYKLGSIDASGTSITNAYWTNFYATNFSAWNIVVSNTHPTAMVRLIGAAFANTNQSGLGLWMTKRGGGSLFEGTNCNATVFSNVYAPLDLDLAFSEWKEGANPGYVTNYANALEQSRKLWTNAAPTLDWIHIGTHNDRNENYAAQNLATWNFCKKYDYGYLDFNRIYGNWTNMDNAGMTEAGVHGNLTGDLYAAMIGGEELGFPALQHFLDKANLKHKVALFSFPKSNGVAYGATLLGSTRIGTGAILTNAWLTGTNGIDSFTTAATGTNVVNNRTVFNSAIEFVEYQAPLYRGSAGNIWRQNQNGNSAFRWSQYALGDTLFWGFENEGVSGQTNSVMRLQAVAQNSYTLSVGSPSASSGVVFRPAGNASVSFFSGSNTKETFWGNASRSWYMFGGVIMPYSTDNKTVVGLRAGDIIGWSSTATPSDSKSGGIMVTNSLTGVNGAIVSAVGTSANLLTNFAAGNIYLNTNATCPNPLGTGGWLWNSNAVLYWVTATKTNLITDGR